jgi:hypothetical protein
MRPTTTTPTRPEPRPDPEPQAEAEAPESDAAGQGGAPEPARTRPARRTRRDRAQSTDATKGRKLHLPDAVFERLQLLAIQKKSTASAVAADILERNLPRLRISRDD